MDAHLTGTPARTPPLPAPAGPWDRVEALYAWLEEHNRRRPEARCCCGC
ncbi:hypothetical protein SJI45_07400 [Streptomyces sp. S399]|nr:hypothetical protein [Streptomyces sp. S399]WPR50898.1 hypothetical protein SJI45_07400 [Streptomyces sp. S399]